MTRTSQGDTEGRTRTAKVWHSRSLTFLVMLAILNTGLVLFSIHLYGAGTWWDGIQYVRYAREFISEGTLSILYWPPGYPFLLAMTGMILQSDPLSVAGPLNALAFGGIALLTGIYTRKLLDLPIPIIVAATAGVTLCSVALLDTAVLVSSEPLFICFLLLFLIFTERFREDGKLRDLLLMAGFTLAALSLRYAGLAVIATGMVVILFTGPRPVKQKVRSLLLFAGVTVLPAALWLMRNASVHESYFGSRGQSIYSLNDVLSAIAQSTLRWFAPGRAVNILEISFALIAVFLMFRSFSRWQQGKPRRLPARFVAPLLFCILYSALIVITSVTFAHDPVGDRLLLPLQIPITILILAWISYVIRKMEGRRYRIAITTAVLCYGMIWIGYQGVRNTEKTLERVRHGAGGTAHEVIRNSPLLAWLQSHETELTAPVFCNAPDILYIELGEWVAIYPERTHYNSNTPNVSASDFAKLWTTTEQATVIWFSGVYKPFLYTVSDAVAIASIDTIAAFEDGAVYRVYPDTDSLTSSSPSSGK